MKRIFLLLLLACIACQQQEAFTIGVIAPLSGSQAIIGQGLQQGIEIGIDESKNTKVIWQDSQGTPQGALLAYQQLMLNNPDAIIIASTGMKAVIPLAKEEQLPLLTTVASASEVASEGPSIFRYFTNADTDAPTIAQYAVEQGHTSFGILYINDQWGIDYRDRFSEVIEQSGREVMSEAFQYSDYTYKTQLTKLAESEAIYLVGLDYQVIHILKEIRELNLNKPIYSIGTIATAYSIEQAEGTAEGVIVTAFCTDGTPEAFQQKFQAKYNQSANFFAELGYDLMTFMNLASNEGTATREELIKNILSLENIDTNTGQVSSSPEGELIIPICIKRIQNNQIFNLATGKISNY